MNHEHNKETIELLFYGELSGHDREAAESNIQHCAECRAFYEELNKLHGILAHYVPLQATEGLLREARATLRSSLTSAPARQPWWEGLLDRILPASGVPVRLAFGGVMTVAAGFFLGYLAFKSPAPQQQQQPPAATGRTANQERPVLPEGGQISNVKFVDPDARDGEVEFTFDAVMPMHMKGKVNDPQIQQVLSYALLNEQNPGTRLRSVNAMASEHAANTDEDVKRVLITALTSDNNPGVRKEALGALQKFPFDNTIKRAFMAALAKDSNSAIRIDAINALKSASLKDIAGDQDLLNIFRDKVTSDNNPYVRIRAKAVLQEINQ